MNLRLYRGSVFYFIESPLESSQPYVFYEDGGLLIDNNKVKKVGLYSSLSEEFPEAELVNYSGRLIMPGFIDTHIHFPQSEMIGMYGEQLNEWLRHYTYPMEQLYASNDYADRVAEKFIHELLKNGTTSCVAYGTVYPYSVETLFKYASSYDMCLLAGKVMMDRNVPEELRDSVDTGESDSRMLIERWHGVGRNKYVITPRFAITSTKEQLESAGRLSASYPDVYLQTHISENVDEIKTVLELFPDCKDYLEVYERAGLLNDRMILGHGVHLSDDELRRIAQARAIVAHCPTSNAFLGSGLFDMKKANREGVVTTIATDVAGGTSFSMFKTLAEAYKIQQLRGYSLSPMESYYKATLGAAKALKLADKIGSLKPGADADFIVVDYAMTTEQEMRSEYLQRTGNWTIENRLFGLQMLGDDRNVGATYLMGKRVYERMES